MLHQALEDVNQKKLGNWLILSYNSSNTNTHEEPAYFVTGERYFMMQKLNQGRFYGRLSGYLAVLLSLALLFTACGDGVDAPALSLETTAVPPSPTVAPRPKPLTLSGTGNKTSSPYKLASGVARLTISYSGQSNFKVSLLDDTGKWVDTTATAPGPYQGSVYVRVPVTSFYRFEVVADGDWSLDVLDRVALDTEPYNGGPFTGRGDAALTLNVTKSGLTTFKITHNGQGNFVVKIPSAEDGGVFAILTFAVGPYSGEKTITIEPGQYFLSVLADGDWTIQVS